MVCRMVRRSPAGPVLLCGGVFQNALLLRATQAALAGDNREVIGHTVVPPNDGALALGQALGAVAPVSVAECSDLEPASCV